MAAIERKRYRNLEEKWEDYSKRLLYACIIQPDLLDKVDVLPSELHPAVAPAYADLRRKRAAGILDDAYVIAHWTPDELELMEPGDVNATLRVLKPLSVRARLSMVLREAYAGIARRPLDDILASLKEAVSYAVRSDNGDGRSRDGDNLRLIADDVIAMVDNLMDGNRPYVPTTYPNLDGLIGGFWPGNLYVIAGRPGIGKTAFAVNLFARLPRVAPVAFITCEMTREELTMRLLSLLSRVSYFRIRTGRIDKFERGLLDKARVNLPSQATLLEASGKPIEEIVGMILEASREGCKVAIIDYLQRIPYPRGLDSMDLAIGHICKALKNIALKANIAVVVLAQLNRMVEQTSSRRPELHHLRESGNIEQEADLVAFLYREGYYKPEKYPDLPEILEVIVRKNRHGPVGTVRMTFRPTTMEITPEEPEQNQDRGGQNGRG